MQLGLTSSVEACALFKEDFCYLIFFLKTKQLTKSFGWDDNDSFVQHDVQGTLKMSSRQNKLLYGDYYLQNKLELMRVLFDALEKTFQQGENKSAQSQISHFDRGKISDYIKVSYHFLCIICGLLISPV